MRKMSFTLRAPKRAVNILIWTASCRADFACFIHSWKWFNIWIRCLFATNGKTAEKTSADLSITATPNGRGTGTIESLGRVLYKCVVSCSIAPEELFGCNCNTIKSFSLKNGMKGKRRKKSGKGEGVGETHEILFHFSIRFHLLDRI